MLLNMSLPLLVVFDLDYTLWPFWVDTHVTPPFTKTSTGTVVDRMHFLVPRHYYDVPLIFERLKKAGVKIAIASRTGEISGAQQLIHLFGWDKYIDYKEIFSSDKQVHFEKIQKASGIDYSDMLFFDDEERNIVSVGKIGVLCIYVVSGMTMEVLEDGLKQFADKKANESKGKKLKTAKG